MFFHGFLTNLVTCPVENLGYDSIERTSEMTSFHGSLCSEPIFFSDMNLDR
jgi:hypothetical protein